MRKNPPQYVLRVLRGLESRGFSAQLVGGCVRDMIMGRTPTDWDVCTSALPDEVVASFRKTIPTGIRHGTVTVRSGGRNVETTTYRTEGTYADFRRPDSVEFIADLPRDLARRDFTMNAIAMTAEGEIIDPFGGAADIAAGVIRCVGQPQERFREDALRMLRAKRFSAVLGFAIEAETEKAIAQNAQLIKHVAAERICAELSKTLLSDRPEMTAEMLKLSGFAAFDENAAQLAGLRRIRGLPKQPMLRWAAICAVLGLDAKALLTALRLDNFTVKHASDGCKAQLAGFEPSRIGLKRLIAKYGDESAKCAAAAYFAVHGGDIMRRFRLVLSSGECLHASQLAINGDALVEMGFRGTAVGAAINELLQHVIEKPEDNKAEILKKLATKLIR